MKPQTLPSIPVPAQLNLAVLPEKYRLNWHVMHETYEKLSKYFGFQYATELCKLCKPPIGTEADVWIDVYFQAVKRWRNVHPLSTWWPYEASNWPKDSMVTPAKEAIEEACRIILEAHPDYSPM